MVAPHEQHVGNHTEAEEEAQCKPRKISQDPMEKGEDKPPWQPERKGAQCRLTEERRSPKRGVHRRRWLGRVGLRPRRRRRRGHPTLKDGVRGRQSSEKRQGKRHRRTVI